MIKLFLLFLSFNAFAQNSIPESEVIKAINLEPNAGSVTCEQLPNEKCYDYTGIDWTFAELVTEITQDELGINVETKVLKLSEVKKAEREAIREAKRIAKEAKIAQKEANKAELFALKKSDIDNMTVSQRNAVIFKLLNIVQEIEE